MSTDLLSRKCERDFGGGFQILSRSRFNFYKQAAPVVPRVGRPPRPLPHSSRRRVSVTKCNDINSLTRCAAAILCFSVSMISLSFRARRRLLCLNFLPCVLPSLAPVSAQRFSEYQFARSDHRVTWPSDAEPGIWVHLPLLLTQHDSLL